MIRIIQNRYYITEHLGGDSYEIFEGPFWDYDVARDRLNEIRANRFSGYSFEVKSESTTIYLEG